MSNQWDPNAQQQPPAQPPGTPPPPGAYPPPAGYQPPAKGNKKGKIAVGAVGLLLVGGAGAFALTNMGGSGGGPSNPEDAVQEVLEAVDNEDVLGLLGAIDPGERDALRDNAEALLGHFERIEVLDDSFEASGVSGIDIEIDFDTVEYETEEIREGLTRVEITAGEIDFEVDLSEIPTGDLVADLQEQFGGEGLEGGTSGSVDFADLEDPLFLVARDSGDDGWRVSIGYTIAETARVEAGEPDLEDPIDAIGEDSPEAAVEGFLREFEGDSLDTENLVARLSPSELGALQEYFYTLGGETLPTQDFEDIEVAIDELELSSEEDGNTALVSIDGFTVGITNNDFDETIVVEFDGDCLNIDTSDAPSAEDTFENTPFEDEVCISEPLDLDEAVDEAVPEGVDLPDPPELGELDFGEFKIATAKYDGEWYVAPVNTGLTGVNTFLDGIDRETIEELVEYGGSLVGLATEVFFDEAFDVDDIAIPDGPDEIEVDTTTPPDTTNLPSSSPDFDSIEPNPSLGISDDELLDLQGVASYVGDNPEETECAYEAMVSGDYDWEELVRSFNEDSAPSDAAEAMFEDIESVCG